MSSWPPAQVLAGSLLLPQVFSPSHGCLNQLFRRHCVLSQLMAISPLPLPKGWEAGGQDCVMRI